MKQFLIRDKFKTELGKQMFDELKAIKDDAEWMYLIFYHCKGDENKKNFLAWLHKKDRTPQEIIEKIVFN